MHLTDERVREEKDLPWQENFLYFRIWWTMGSIRLREYRVYVVLLFGYRMEIIESFDFSS